MAAKLETAEALGNRPIPEGAGGIARYRADMPEREAPGQAMVRAGGELGSEGDKLFATYKSEQLKVDTLRAEDAYTQLQNQKLQMTYGPGGYATKRGQDAVVGMNIQSASAAFDDIAKRIGESLSNDDQKRLFKERANVASTQFQEGFLRHQLQERNVWATDVTNNGVQSELNGIAANYSNPSMDPVAAENATSASLVRIRGLLNAHADDLGMSVAAVDKAYSTAVDQAVTKKLLGLASWNPVGAYTEFRGHEQEISDPAHRLQLGNLLRERAAPVQSATEGQGLLDTARRTIAPHGDMTPTTGEETFKSVVGSLIQREGGYVAKDGKSGAPAKFGINQRANPDIDVANLTPAGATAIYKERYWKKIDGDNLAPATALVALDTAALQGVGVAKALLASTGGDPQAMIEARRPQLIAIAKDPAQAPNLQGWLTRLDGLSEQVSQMPDGGMRKVSATDRVLMPNTTAQPTARQLAAMLPMALMGVEKRANELFGKDLGNAERQAFIKQTEDWIRSKNVHDVQMVENQQKEALQAVGNFILGPVLAGGQPQPGAGGMMPVGSQGQPGGAVAGGRNPMQKVTSIAQVFADPAAASAYQALDFNGKQAVATMIKVNANDSERGDPALYNELRNDIVDGKINWNDQIEKDPRVRAGNLNIGQLNALRERVKLAATEDGRTQGALVQTGTRIARGIFRGDQLLTSAYTNMGMADVAEELFSRNASRVVAEYRKANNKDVSELFDITNPKSLIYPPNLEQWKILAKAPATTPEMLSQMAAATRAAGAPVTSEPPTQAPATLKTAEDVAAWVQTLPVNVTQFVDHGGVVRTIPGRNPAAPGSAIAALPAAVAAPAVPVVVAKPRKEIPEFSSRGRGQASEAEQARMDLHQGGLWAAAKAVAGTAFDLRPAGRMIANAPSDLASMISGLVDVVRQKAARATFQKLVDEGTFYKDDVPLIKGALDYGNLDPADEKKARAMLKAAGQ